ncbi:MAG: TlpA disulfide reductase family protein [Rhodobacteraceae bacterium]|nr:TlpA disulfide reductase family protein [Paracoccaceae bacterium]
MRFIFPRVAIYVLTCLLTIHATGLNADQDLAALRDGSLRKLVIHDAPKANTYGPLEAMDGSRTHLQDLDSTVLVVNFFAVWCAPCRIEMPSLDQLQSQFNAEDLTVLVIATGRHAEGAIETFLTETRITNLTILRDPTGAFSRSLGVFGLPTTLLLDANRDEVARLVGDADWDSASAVAIMTRMLEG